MINRALLLCFGAFILTATVSAHSIPVNPTGNLKSISAAIELSNPGDTILVSTGTYREGNILINKPLTLIGIGSPVIDGQLKYENFSVKSDSVEISGFKIINSGVSSLVDYAGIKIYNSSDVVISNNTMENCFFGIYTQNGKSCKIINNHLKATTQVESQSGNGIHCWRSDSMQIIGNIVDGHRDGIYFEFVINSIIWRNTAINNLRYGLHFMFSNNDTYAVNRFENNGAGVSVMFSKHVKMFNNWFKRNWGDAAYGILLKEISDSYIQGNIFEMNTSAIYMEGASRIEMYRNQFLNNGWGLKIQASCMDIVLERNNFIGNSFDVGTNGSLVLNRFENNYWDKYEGYDLKKDGIGDIPYRPVSMYSMIIEKNPIATILFRSLIADLMDRSERLIPSLTPENLKDNHPLMKPVRS